VVSESLETGVVRTIDMSDLDFLNGGRYRLEELRDDGTGHKYALVTENMDPMLVSELGSTSPSPWTSWTRQEYNQDLVGLKGLQAWDRMRKSDGGVRSTLRGAKMPILSARWMCEPCKSKGGKKSKPKKKEIDAAWWVWYNLDSLMSMTFKRVLAEALLMLDFGYYMFELVWENQVIDGKRRTVLTKMAPRHPMDVACWNFDHNGGPVSVEFYPPTEWQTTTNVVIPIEKLVVFTFDQECGDITGISMLRSAYKHWYYKENLYKIDAIQKERNAVGIPVIKLPVGYKPADKIAADQLGRNLRTNERAHVVLPPGWELMMLKLEGKVIDCIGSIEHHDSQIRLNVLGEFFKEGADQDSQQLFLKASRFIADIAEDTFNKFVITKMTKYNYTNVDPPRIKARRMGENTDWRDLSFAVRNYIGASAIRPDDPLEDMLREEMDLPAADPSTARDVVAPPVTPAGGDANLQTGGKPAPKTGGTPPPGAPKAGLPRQAKAGNAKQGKTPGSTRVGKPSGRTA
jgi:hypothetical protein